MESLVILDETPQHRCARIQAESDGQLCDIYVGCRLNEDIESLVLPAFKTGSGAKVMLLTISVSQDSDEADSVAKVDRFVEDWSPIPEETVPVIVKIPAE